MVHEVFEIRSQGLCVNRGLNLVIFRHGIRSRALSCVVGSFVAAVCARVLLISTTECDFF